MVPAAEPGIDIENRFVGLRFAGKRKKKSRGASYQTKQQHQTKQHHRVSLSRRLGPPVSAGTAHKNPTPAYPHHWSVPHRA
jgi:hypothetical protein